MIALSTLILAILFFMVDDALWLLFVMSAVRALGAGIQTPATGTYKYAAYMALCGNCCNAILTSMLPIWYCLLLEDYIIYLY